MKIKKEYFDNPTKLMELGFSYEKITDGWDDECYETRGKLVYNMGHSRRGQFYYLIIEDDCTISVFSTTPDGSGTSVLMDDVIIEMFKNDMFEI